MAASIFSGTSLQTSRGPNHQSPITNHPASAADYSPLKVLELFIQLLQGAFSLPHLSISPSLHPPISQSPQNVEISLKSCQTPDPSVTDVHADMHPKKPDLGDLWIQHQRRNNRTTSQSWACIHCLERTVFHSADQLWKHAEEKHRDKFPPDPSHLQQYRRTFESESAAKRSVNMAWALFPDKADEFEYYAKTYQR